MDDSVPSVSGGFGRGDIGSIARLRTTVSTHMSLIFVGVVLSMPLEAARNLASWLWGEGPRFGAEGASSHVQCL